MRGHEQATMPDGVTILLLIVGAAAGYALALVRYRRPVRGAGRGASSTADGGTGTPRAAGSLDEEPSSSARQGARLDVERLYQIAEQLEPNEATKLGNPHDILGHELFEEGVSLLTEPAVPLDQVVGYALGTNWVVGIMGSEALARRADARPAVQRVLTNIGQSVQWPLFFRLRFLGVHADRPVIGPVVLASEHWWVNHPTTVAAVDGFIGTRVTAGDPVTFGEALEGTPADRLEEIEEFVRRLDERHAGPLLDEIRQYRAGALDPTFIASAGKLWRSEVTGPTVGETRTVTAVLEEMRAAFAEGPPRSVLLVGEPGVGKTALRRRFSRELSAARWRIFETSGSQLLAGTRYVGDIETRVAQLLENAAVAKRVVLYVDRLEELATVGATEQHPVSVLDQLWPYLKAQQVVMVSEATPGAYQALERRHPGLPLVMKVMRLMPASVEETTQLASSLLNRAQPHTAEASRLAVVRDAIQLAQSYMAHRAFPGGVLGLLELALARAATRDSPQPIEREHLLAALNELTGLPLEVLDDEQQLDVGWLRDAFRSRVIGQDEAVDCLVERIAMLKAGLTDPQRPVGVFLFAGPTGTGKTEIAKTLATLLFGSPEQMIRLDMSEFQTPAALGRLLGEAGSDRDPRTATLVQRIRQQPFSVVLLDEFEKSHENVWDLFLQVFDDGRLTDRQGNLADFRHAIIILTSNLGATISNEAGIGFVGKAGQFSPNEVMRTVNRTFRREFINRLDKVVVFRPLSRQVMRLILRKELDDVLSRRGLRSKAWAVVWEDSAIEFLLAKGFTPDLGARPLRRAIERHLLAPLSMTIVENRAPEGEQFLFVRGERDGLEVEFVDPDAEEEPAGAGAADGAEESALSITGLMRNPSGGNGVEVFLGARVDRILERVGAEQWGKSKSAGLAEMNVDGFWDRDDRHDVLGRVELMDRIESATETLASLTERLRRSDGSPSLTKRVAEKLYVVEAGIADLEMGRPGAAFVGVRLLVEEAGRPDARAFFERLVEMYRRWASRRRMEWSELTAPDVDPTTGRVFLVGGFGCHAILAPETGLHVLEVPKAESSFERIRVRVTVVPDTCAPGADATERLRSARAELAGPAGQTASVVRRYRERPSPLVRDAARGWRTGRIGDIWAGNFDIGA